MGVVRLRRLGKAQADSSRIQPAGLGSAFGKKGYGHADSFVTPRSTRGFHGRQEQEEVRQGPCEGARSADSPAEPTRCARAGRRRDARQDTVCHRTAGGRQGADGQHGGQLPTQGGALHRRRAGLHGQSGPDPGPPRKPRRVEPPRPIAWTPSLCWKSRPRPGCRNWSPSATGA